MAQKRHSPGSPSPHGPGALGPESRFLPQITPIRRKGDGARNNRLSGVLRAAGETIISEYSIFHGTLRPSAYTPKRWVGQETREDQRTAQHYPTGTGRNNAPAHGRPTASAH